MADRATGWLAAAAGVVAIAGIVGWHALGPADSATAARVRGIPDPGLAPLMAFAAPMTAADVQPRGASQTIVSSRDPFLAHAAPRIVQSASVSNGNGRPAEPEWNVTAILVAGTRRAAVINDVLLYEGDALPNGARLTAVARDRVVVTDSRGASHTVTVKEGDS